MKILLTGANGFIGKNLTHFLSKKANVEILSVTRDTSKEDFETYVNNADWIIHLAGINRPKEEKEFVEGNVDLTNQICQTLINSNQKTPIIFASSIQADKTNPYGLSKRAAEDALKRFSSDYGSPIFICRLANVFGKWSRPNYNSAVATFCHNVANDLPIEIHSADAVIRLVYIDDVMEIFWGIINGEAVEQTFYIEPEYQITVGKLAKQIQTFKDSRQTMITEKVGEGLTRALYSTYLSFLQPKQFDYSVPKHGDERGVFVEMLKTKDSGQFSYFTAYPGITRGGHYHHTKTEKFLVIKGKALFKFKNLVTDEFYQLETTGEVPTVVETVPGWTHDITNIGDEEMIVMLWANEIFDREKPDTYALPLTHNKSNL